MKIDDETVLSDDDALAAVLDVAGVPRLTVGLLGRVRWLAQVASERGEALARLMREVNSANARISTLESQLQQREASDRAFSVAGHQGVLSLHHELVITRRQLENVFEDRERLREASQRAAAEAAARELKVVQERTAALQLLAELEGANSRLKQLVDDALQRSATLEGKIEGALLRCAELDDKIAALERVS